MNGGGRYCVMRGRTGWIVGEGQTYGATDVWVIWGDGVYGERRLPIYTPYVCRTSDSATDVWRETDHVGGLVMADLWGRFAPEGNPLSCSRRLCLCMFSPQ